MNVALNIIIQAASLSKKWNENIKCKIIKNIVIRKGVSKFLLFSIFQQILRQLSRKACVD